MHQWANICLVNLLLSSLAPLANAALSLSLEVSPIGRVDTTMDMCFLKNNSGTAKSNILITTEIISTF